ncbi:MAG: hypothetical protein HC822_26975 [Oscillochloris sp.]|nr:hypothetical protein [Oscillochloris sp.]
MERQESEALRRDLLLEQEINRRLDAVIKRATQTTLQLDGNRDMEVSQLRNLLNTAIESRGSIEVVVNFIRYQIARSPRAWGQTSQSFGHQVIADLRGPISTMATEVADKVLPLLKAEADPELRQDAFARLMQLYLGYLHRTFYFARRVGSFDSLQEVGGGD